MQHLLTALVAAFAPACYLPPVDAPVARPFVAPACTYCPGHRGLEYDLDAGTTVRAVAGGLVTFSGVVAGTRYIVVLQNDGLSATYGQLERSVLHVGESMGVGDVVGASSDTLYFGLRDGERYLDPQPRLGRWKRRARLVPSGGRAPRPAAAPTLQCPPSSAKAVAPSGAL